MKTDVGEQHLPRQDIFLHLQPEMCNLQVTPGKQPLSIPSFIISLHAGSAHSTGISVLHLLRWSLSGRGWQEQRQAASGAQHPVCSSCLSVYPSSGASLPLHIISVLIPIYLSTYYLSSPRSYADNAPCLIFLWTWSQKCNIGYNKGKKRTLLSYPQPLLTSKFLLLLCILGARLFQCVSHSYLWDEGM